jgi:hypothetical protein
MMMTTTRRRMKMRMRMISNTKRTFTMMMNQVESMMMIDDVENANDCEDEWMNG